MGETMSSVVAIKRYMERVDSIAPNGGQKVTTTEMKDLTKADRTELGALAARELGVEIKNNN